MPRGGVRGVLPAITQLPPSVLFIIFRIIFSLSKKTASIMGIRYGMISPNNNIDAFYLRNPMIHALCNPYASMVPYMYVYMYCIKAL